MRQMTIPRRLREVALVAGVLAGALAFVTWPYAAAFTNGLPDNIDPMFSIWRLSWFAHAVRAHVPIANANIFYPETGTFAFSDTIFLLDALAAPFLWLGVDKVIVYNVLLAAGFIGSGLALFMAARALQISSAAALVGAAIFTLAPYRMEHIVHLELQWLVGSIAAVVSIVLITVRPSLRIAFTLAASLVFQFLTSIYYAVFMLPLLGVIWLGCIPIMPKKMHTVRLTLVGGAVAGILIAPVASLHLQQRARLGGRQINEVEKFSATLADYLATPDENRVYGVRRTNDVAVWERRLFPGTIALALAVVGLFSHRRRTVVLTVAVTALAVDLSLGTNGTLYPYLYRGLPPWQGLRAPARYGAYVLLGIAALASLGWERLLQLKSGVPRGSPSRFGYEWLLTLVVIVLLCVEYRSPPRLWHVRTTPAVYKMIAKLPPGIILEYPTPSKDSIGWIDADYAFWSTTHWRTLVNGYSGYHPTSFWERAARLERFPSDDTIAELCALGVRYVLVHPWAINQPRRAELVQKLALRDELKHIGSFSDWQLTAELFELATSCRNHFAAANR
jgi:hypothetical protein